MANEKRLIDANALMEQFDDSFKGFVMKRIIETQPTVDAVEVVHGRWIDTDYKPDIYCKCSECGRRVYAYDDGYNYCPNCGAKMDGDGNG